MSPRWPLLILTLAIGCRRAHSQPAAPPRERPRVVAPAAPPAPSAPPVDDRAGWTAALHLAHKPVAGHGLHDVIVHAPPGFDAHAPLHLVIFFHGIWSQAAQWVVAGDLAPVTGARGGGWGLATRHDRAAVNALLVAPQLRPQGTAGFAGEFRRPGFLREFLGELLGETLAARLGGARRVEDIASLTLVGASAGGPVIATLLAQSDLADRVRNVVVVDGLYGGEAAFASWLRASTPAAPRRFVCVHAGSRYTAPHVTDLVRRLGGRGPDVALNPRGALADAVRRSRAVFATVPCEHVAMTDALYDKIVPSLGLPPRGRAPAEPMRVPSRPPAPVVGVLTLDVPTRGALRRGDPLLRDWTRFDDWSVDLAAGQRVRVEVSGERTAGAACARYDVEVEVLDGDRVLARDDDGGGGLGARVELTAPRTGRFTVRVLTHDTWGTDGGYTVQVKAAE